MPLTESERKKRKLESQKLYREKNKDKIRESNKIYKSTHIKQDREQQRIRRLANGTTRTFLDGEYTWKSKLTKETILNLFVGKCVVCGETDPDKLTIDHINNDGYVDRKKYNISSSIRLVRRLIKQNWTLDNLKEKFQVLCFNHNCAKAYRKYLDLPENELSYKQKWRIKIWKEAYAFFGPCSCGQSDLRFLTLSHIHDDGAERRRNGEKYGSDLFINFRKLEWSESIKDDFCLECFNCNCSRQIKKKYQSKTKSAIA